VIRARTAWPPVTENLAYPCRYEDEKRQSLPGFRHFGFLRLSLIFSTIALSLASVASGQTASAPVSVPLVIGETFTINSNVLHEVRRINVYLPAGYADAPGARLPVLYMPDGGMAEDFLHVAGLVQVGVGNGTMRPFILFGMENTERRRDMTGPTNDPDDRKIAPRVGGSAAFRQFVRKELMPRIKERYRTTDETAIVGESLAGLFVVETLFLEPDLFDTYIAFDPSLWWNKGRLVSESSDRLKNWRSNPKTLFIATSSNSGLAQLGGQLATSLRSNTESGLKWQLVSLPDETHATIYHPAALRAFRLLFKPAAVPDR